MPDYEPSPIDTSGIALDMMQRELVERLAENAHDVWARQRLADGWSYGLFRDDAHKLHPMLVPYDDLPESEKIYDRILVEQVLKSAIALGYSIIRR